MEKTINKNVDSTLFGQLKAIDFEYLVQLNGIIGDYTENFGADTLDEEMVKFDITLNNVVKVRIEELISAEAKIKEIIAEERETNTVKYVKESREYLDSVSDIFEGKIVDSKCLEIIERLKKNIYDFGSLETQISVLKTLIETDIFENDSKETVERAKLAGFLASFEVVREVEQEQLDKGREYLNAIKIEDEEEIKNLIDDYKLIDNLDFCGWYMSNKLGLAHLDEVFLVEYIEDEKMHFVFQDGQDFDCCDSYCLE